MVTDLCTFSIEQLLTIFSCMLQIPTIMYSKIEDRSLLAIKILICVVLKRVYNCFECFIVMTNFNETILQMAVIYTMLTS